MHLAYDLAEGFETTILVDAVAARRASRARCTSWSSSPAGRPRRGAGPRSAESRCLTAHGMQPDVVFGMLDMLGADAGRVLLVGCEPASIDERIGLSAPVAAAVDEAVRIVLDLVAQRATPDSPRRRRRRGSDGRRRG